MGRHSRRGPAPRADAADNAATRDDRTAGRAPDPPRRENGNTQGPHGSRGSHGPHESYGPHELHGPHGSYGSDWPPQGAQGTQGAQGSQGVPRQAAWGEAPGGRQGYAAPGPGRVGGPGPGPGFPDGTPAHGFPRPAADGTPARGVPRVRGGHPEQREPGGGWGEPNGWRGAGHGPPAGPHAGAAPDSFAPASSPSGPSGPSAPFPRQRRAPQEGPRQDYLDAFGEDDDVFAARPARRPPGPAGPADPYAAVTDWSAADGGAVGDGGAGGGGVADDGDDQPPTGEPAPGKGAKGRTFTGIAAAAVTTVLAVVVAGQVADGSDGDDMRSQSAAEQARGAHDPASRDDERPTPPASEAAKPLTYEQKMGKTYPLSTTLKGSGKFDAIPGIAKGTGKGEKYTYRVDVEQGLGLDGQLFADAVQKTLNDDRSWSHNGARTFERIESGQPNFVITLASPGTTAEWCAKSGLDTTEDNVSCDSAATERVMINAYRWAQGAEPYGDAIHAYRQMLINHEVGHRIGFNHVTCDKDGELAPVMQQQTKFIDHDGIDCRPNPWAYPNS
ncbi:DUF3152 domain-containing protein [Streptomyces coelicoflavus]|uniref:DUF3152 domain-containing protein n=1 Tax=Streptomyces coelicoflavus TaxID=285562 RepID=UPI0036B1FBB4